MALFDIVRKAMLASLGVQERVSELIDDLVKRGELSQGEGSKIFKEWMDKAQQSSTDLTGRIQEAVTGALKQFPIATKSDVEEIQKRLDTLSTRVQKMEGGEG